MRLFLQHIADDDHHTDGLPFMLFANMSKSPSVFRVPALAPDPSHEMLELARVAGPRRSPDLISPAKINNLHLEPAELGSLAEHLRLQLRRSVPGLLARHGHVN